MDILGDELNIGDSVTRCRDPRTGEIEIAAESIEVLYLWLQDFGNCCVRLAILEDEVSAP